MRSTSTDFEDFFGISENSKVVKTTDVTATLPTNKGNAKLIVNTYIHSYHSRLENYYFLVNNSSFDQ